MFVGFIFFRISLTDGWDRLETCYAALMCRSDLVALAFVYLDRNMRQKRNGLDIQKTLLSHGGGYNKLFDLYQT